MNKTGGTISKSIIYDIDEEIIARISMGDEQAFKTLYECYFTFLCTSATYYVFDADLSREIVNDVFIKIWTKREGLTYPIHAYLQTCVRNWCFNHIRSKKARLSMVDEYGKETLRLQEIQLLRQETPFDICEFRELEKQIDLSVQSLPSKCRAIFERYLYAGRSPKEIAEEMGLSVNTVRVQVKIALDRIKANLSPYVGMLIFILNQRLDG